MRGVFFILESIFVKEERSIGLSIILDVIVLFYAITDWEDWDLRLRSGIDERKVWNSSTSF